MGVKEVKEATGITAGGVGVRIEGLEGAHLVNKG